MIAVIDYGMGNLRSVQKALEKTGGKAMLTDDPEMVARAEKIVFPGVGAFGDAMKELERRGLDRAIKGAIASGKQFLGLCLGMQLLFEKSEEAPGAKGLCVLEGSVKRFRFKGRALKVPHMGWNRIAKQMARKALGGGMLRGVPDGSYMYFVHSYFVEPKEKDLVLTTTDYGRRFVSGICKDNIVGLQFHPEKSQGLGLRILKNFVEMRCG
jgi:glutamine amidotransferase